MQKLELSEEDSMWKEKENKEILDKLHDFDYTKLCKDRIDRWVFIEHIQRGSTLNVIYEKINVSVSTLKYRKKRLIKRLRKVIEQ